jgi:hypothetical protein
MQENLKNISGSYMAQFSEITLDRRQIASWL